MNPKILLLREPLLSSACQPTLRGHQGFIGHAWNDHGPSVLGWQESSEFVIWVVAFGTDQQAAIDLAQASVKLDADHWKQATQIDDRCFSK